MQLIIDQICPQGCVPAPTGTSVRHSQYGRPTHLRRGDRITFQFANATSYAECPRGRSRFPARSDRWQRPARATTGETS